jgi:tetratricopeptide (TPR) repeat protein
MNEAPIGAVISYWLRPTPERAHIHRIEVEHALYLAVANQEQIKDTLTEMLRRQTTSMENISLALDELRDEIAAGFSAVAEGVARVDHTLHQGFYQLHLDELGTHARLDDILSCLLDKDGFQRELAARHAAAEARYARYQASSVFADAMTLTRRALNENNIAKAGAMLNEAIALFGRASLHTDFALEAHFQLGYLEQQHRRNINAAYAHYGKALGPAYSSHFVRTSRHIAHLDYLTGHHAEAVARMQSLIDHDEAITAFARDLQIANNQPWDNDACILALEGALARHKPLLEQCPRLSDVRRQFDDQRRFSATERFLESYSLIMQELHALRPDMRVYYDAARYAIGAGQSSLAVPWLKHCHDAQPTLNARRAFLLEAMADEDLRHA